MRRGFTILELLVASLLLGMLVTILTMIFNQSSIAWRTGKSGNDDLIEMRHKIAGYVEESDNAFKYDGSLYRLQGLWDSSGDPTKFRQRTVDTSFDLLAVGDVLEDGNFPMKSVGSGKSQNADGYVVNVMSAGPDREFETYDDIWSWPDDFK